MDAGPVLGCVAGLVIMAATARGAWASIHLSGWERVAGSVSGVYVAQTRSGAVLTDQGHMEYRYALRGLRTGRFHCCLSTLSRQRACASIAPFSRGQPLDVYVYTARPNVSKLSARFDPAYAGIFCTGLFFFSAFLAVGLSLA